MTVTKYLGLENEENKSDVKEARKPIFTGETGVSITAYTSIDLDLPFKLNSLTSNPPQQLRTSYLPYNNMTTLRLQNNDFPSMILDNDAMTNISSNIEERK